MSDEEQKDCDCVPGLPAWMGTFADLMSLLMCFFVLLLSFAEMDVLKFKRLAGSMREAFGVQNQVDAYLKKMVAGIWQEAPQHFVTSSSKTIGRDEVLNFIGQVNQQFFEAGH